DGIRDFHVTGVQTCALPILKEPQTYEHVPPETVGNTRKVMVSDQGGKSNFIAELKRRGIAVAKDDPRLDTLIALVKDREAQGYRSEERRVGKGGRRGWSTGE